MQQKPSEATAKQNKKRKVDSSTTEQKRLLRNEQDIEKSAELDYNNGTKLEGGTNQVTKKSGSSIVKKTKNTKIANSRDDNINTRVTRYTRNTVKTMNDNSFNVNAKLQKLDSGNAEQSGNLPKTSKEFNIKEQVSKFVVSENSKLIETENKKTKYKRKGALKVAELKQTKQKIQIIAEQDEEINISPLKTRHQKQQVKNGASLNKVKQTKKDDVPVLNGRSSRLRNQPKSSIAISKIRKPRK